MPSARGFEAMEGHKIESVERVDEIESSALVLHLSEGLRLYVDAPTLYDSTGELASLDN